MQKHNPLKIVIPNIVRYREEFKKDYLEAKENNTLDELNEKYEYRREIKNEVDILGKPYNIEHVILYYSGILVKTNKNILEGTDTFSFDKYNGDKMMLFESSIDLNLNNKFHHTYRSTRAEGSTQRSSSLFDYEDSYYKITETYEKNLNPQTIWYESKILLYSVDKYGNDDIVKIVSSLNSHDTKTNYTEFYRNNVFTHLDADTYNEIPNGIQRYFEEDYSFRVDTGRQVEIPNSTNNVIIKKKCTPESIRLENIRNTLKQILNQEKININEALKLNDREIDFKLISNEFYLEDFSIDNFKTLCSRDFIGNDMDFKVISKLESVVINSDYYKISPEAKQIILKTGCQSKDIYLSKFCNRILNSPKEQPFHDSGIKRYNEKTSIGVNVGWPMEKEFSNQHKVSAETNMEHEIVINKDTNEVETNNSLSWNFEHTDEKKNILKFGKDKSGYSAKYNDVEIKVNNE